MRSTSTRTWLLVAATLVLVAAVAVAREAWSDLLPTIWMVDFSVYLGGGDAVLAGVPLYTVGVDTAFLQDMPFTYPPFTALLFVPLSLLGPGLGAVVWTAVNTGALAAVLWLALGMAGVTDRRLRGLLTAVGTPAATVLDPVLVNAELGQINMVVALLVLLDMSGAVPRRWRGVATGIAAGIKLIPLIFVAYLLVTGRRVTAARAVGGFAGTVLFGFLVLPSDSAAYWLTLRFLDSSNVVISPVLVNHSLPGLVARLGGTETAPGWLLLVSAVLAVAGLVMAAWARRHGGELLGVLTVAWTALVVSPVSWPFHAVWIVPTLVWLAFAGWRRGVLLPRLALAAVTLWFVVPLYEPAQRMAGAVPYPFTTAGNLIATFGGQLVVTALAIATMPVWVRRLRTHDGDATGAPENEAVRAVGRARSDAPPGR